MRVLYPMLVIAYFALCVTNACQADPVDDFVTRVESTDAWAAMPIKDFAKKSERLNELGRDFQKLPLKDAKRVVEKIAEKDDSIDGQSRLYILLRFYFAVPEFEDPAAFKSFGGWQGIKERMGRVNALFPLAQNRDGSVYVKDSFRGYLGPGYSPLREWEYFAVKYGPRKK